MSEKVTIIITAYNSEPFVERAILAAVEQTYRNKEIIVVDDCSIDNTFAICSSILKKLSIDHLLIKNDKNLGISHSRNTGIKHSKGEWIYFLDADDYIDKNSIEMMMKHAENKDVVFASFDVVSDIAKPSKTIYRKSKDIDIVKLEKDFLIRKRRLLCPGTLYRKSFLLENDLFFKELRWSEDQHFLWRIINKANSISILDANCYHYVVNGSSTMSQTPFDRIVDSYKFFKNLDALHWRNKKTGKYLSSRWVVGSLNSAAHMTSKFVQWKALFDRMDGKASFKKMLSFPDFKTRLLACLALANLKVYFKHFNKMRDRR